MSRSLLVQEFKLFREKCIELQSLVSCFNLLYGSEESISVLKSFALNFFGDLHGWMKDLYFIYAARLLDPADQKGHKNLSVEHIKKACQAEGVSTDSIAMLACKLVAYRELIGQSRHKVIAHLDLKSASSNDFFGAHSKAEYSQFLSDIQCFCDEVGRAIGEGPLDFSYQPGPGDATDLIFRMRGYLAQQQP